MTNKPTTDELIADLIDWEKRLGAGETRAFVGDIISRLKEQQTQITTLKNTLDEVAELIEPYEFSRCGNYNNDGVMDALTKIQKVNK